MSKEAKILKLEVRIPLLEERPKDNARVVQKLKRQYRNLTGKDFAAAGAENA
jgi:hypothetical protein